MCALADRLAGRWLAALLAGCLASAGPVAAATFLDRPSMTFLTTERVVIAMPRGSGAAPELRVLDLEQRRLDRALPPEMSRTTMVAGRPERWASVDAGALLVGGDRRLGESYSFPWARPRGMDICRAFVVATPAEAELHLIPLAKDTGPMRYDLAARIEDFAVVGAATASPATTCLRDHGMDVVAILADGTVGGLVAGQGGWQTIRQPSIDLPTRIASGGDRSNLVVWGDTAGALQFYDADRMMMLRREERHPAPVTAVVGSGSAAISADATGTLLQWDWRSQSLGATLSDRGGPIDALAIRDGDVLALRQSGVLERYNTGSQRLVGTYEIAIW